MKWSVKQLSTVLAYLAVAPSVVYGAENSAIASKDSAVVKLTAETFDSFIKENPLVLLEFFAPWCGHCKNLGPEFSAAADELVEKNIRLAQVDCTEERDLCQEFGISGYPTLKVFKEDIDATDYKGGRTSDSIITYMIKLSQPSVTVAKTEAEIEDILKSSNGAVMIQIETKGADNTTFHNLAKQLDEKISFISVEKPMGKFAKSKANYVVIRPNDEDISEFEGDLTLSALEEFALVQSKPLFGVIDGNTFQEYMASELPLAYYFHETEEERELIADLLTKLAKKYRGEINFVSIDAVKFGRHALNLNMEENFPMFAIHNLTSNLKYGLPSSTSLNKEIESFVEKFVSGKLEPIVKSEEIPTLEELADSPVYKIVGKTHDDLIKSGKKVLVMYHAPWCGHCKKLHPIYEELLSLISADPKAKEEIIIGNLDGTVNDVNVDITGYPTLILYEGENEPVVFKGARDLENLAEFVGFDLSNSSTEPEDEEDHHDEL